jgi:hypothetical protein
MSGDGNQNQPDLLTSDCGLRTLFCHFFIYEQKNFYIINSGRADCGRDNCSGAGEQAPASDAESRRGHDAILTADTTADAETRAAERCA